MVAVTRAAVDKFTQEARQEELHTQHYGRKAKVEEWLVGERVAADELIDDNPRHGDKAAAQEAFKTLGRVAGEAMATAVTLIDGIVAIGGGLSAAAHWIMPSLLESMRATLHTLDGEQVSFVQMSVYNLDNPEEFKQFAKGEVKKIKVYGEERYVDYDSKKRVGVTISQMGASKAVSLGAYTFAISELDKR